MRIRRSQIIYLVVLVVSVAVSVPVSTKSSKSLQTTTPPSPAISEVKKNVTNTRITLKEEAQCYSLKRACCGCCCAEEPHNHNDDYMKANKRDCFGCCCADEQHDHNDDYMKANKRDCFGCCCADEQHDHNDDYLKANKRDCCGCCCADEQHDHNDDYLKAKRDCCGCCCLNDENDGQPDDRIKGKLGKRESPEQTTLINDEFNKKIGKRDCCGCSGCSGTEDENKRQNGIVYNQPQEPNSPEIGKDKVKRGTSGCCGLTGLELEGCCGSSAGNETECCGKLRVVRSDPDKGAPPKTQYLNRQDENQPNAVITTQNPKVLPKRETQCSGLNSEDSITELSSKPELKYSFKMKRGTSAPEDGHTQMKRCSKTTVSPPSAL